MSMPLPADAGDIRACSRKHVHLSKASAKAAATATAAEARRLGLTEPTVYRCRACAYWHIGRPSKTERDLAFDAARRDADQRCRIAEARGLVPRKPAAWPEAA